MFAQFGDYIYRLNNIFEGIDEIDSQISLNQQTEKSTDFRYMKGRYTYHLQGNLRPQRENKIK